MGGFAISRAYTLAELARGNKGLDGRTDKEGQLWRAGSERATATNLHSPHVCNDVIKYDITLTPYTPRHMRHTHTHTRAFIKHITAQ